MTIRNIAAVAATSVALTGATAALFWWLDGWAAGLDQRALERANITEPQWRLACAAATFASAMARDSS